jgi:predicted nucleotidyltransferase
VVNGLRIRIIALEDLIAVKAHVGRPKDRHVELELRAIRELRVKLAGGP